MPIRLFRLFRDKSVVSKDDVFNKIALFGTESQEAVEKIYGELSGFAAEPFFPIMDVPGAEHTLLGDIDEDVGTAVVIE